MNRNRIFTIFAIAITVMVATSCAITSHPNEKIIVGLWTPVKVEKIVDSSALLASPAMAGNKEQQQSKTGKPGGEGGVSRERRGTRQVGSI
jgi:hypothetical protein